MMMPEFSANAILAGIIFGIVGWLLFKEGKKRTCSELYFIGIGLMIYPYFVTNAVLVWLAGIGLTVAGFYFMKNS
ncbi:MAG: hypothetical protein R3A80_08935 [Bdellovibrionota bacterium]